MVVFFGVFFRCLRFLFRGFLFSFRIFMMFFSRLRFLGRCCFMLFFMMCSFRRRCFGGRRSRSRCGRSFCSKGGRR